MIRLNATSRNIVSFAIPGFFTGLVFFFLPHAEGGYRTVKWACAGIMIALLTGLLLRRPRTFYLPANTLLLIAALALPAGYIIPLLAGEADMLLSCAGILRYGTGLASALLMGSLWACLDDTQKKRTLLMLLTIAAAATLPVIFDFLGMYWDGIVFEADIAGTFGNPNWAAGYFLTAVPLAIFCLSAPGGGGAKLLAGMSLLMLIAGIIACLSKNALYTGILTLAISSYTVLKKRYFLPYVFFVCIPLLLIGAFYYREMILSSLQPRLFIWQSLLLSLKDTWLIGNGPFQALCHIEEGMAHLVAGNPDSYMPASQIEFVYNDYIQALAEGGLAGGAAFLVLVVATLWKAFRSGNTIIHAAGISFLSLCLFGLGDSALQVPVTFFAWWILAGIIWLDDTAVRGRGIAGAGKVTMLLVLILIFSAAEGVRQGCGAWFWTKSGATTTLVDQKQCLQRACFFIPETGNVRTEYARSLNRSRRCREAQVQALKAKAVKFDYDELYLLAQCDIDLNKKEPLAAWQEISDRFPCLNYPKLQRAKLYFKERMFEAARSECESIIHDCRNVNRRQPFYENALSIIDAIDRLPRHEQ